MGWSHTGGSNKKNRRSVKNGYIQRIKPNNRSLWRRSSARKGKRRASGAVEAIDDYIKIPTPENRFHLIDEMADVEVMLEQLKIMNVCRDEVAGRVRYKINRQMERIRNGE